MKYKQQKQYRLKGFDYSQTGYYFVTMCTKDRMCCFGDIVDGEMRLSEIGRVAKDELLRTAKIRSNIILDDHVVMPNHVHAILIIMDGRNAPRRVPTEPGMQNAPRRVPTMAMVSHAAELCPRSRTKSKTALTSLMWRASMCRS